jgi:hypothetical protein
MKLHILAVSNAHTFHTSIIRLHIRLLDLSILDNKCIPLTTVSTKDRSTIEREI